MSAHHAVDPYLTLKDIEAITQVNASTIYRWIDKQLFPAPTKLGVNCVRWRTSAINAWQDGLEKKAS